MGMPPVQQPVPVDGGGGNSASTASPDLATALEGLKAAIAGLQAAVDAFAGAAGVAGVSGGGAAEQSSCGCAGLAPPMQQTPRLPDAPPLPLNGPGDSTKPTQVNGPGDFKKPANSTRERIVDLARAEFEKGVKADDGIHNDKAGNIKRYRSAVTGPGEDPNAAEPWCADFASYIYKEAGVPFGKNGQGEDYTVAMIAWAKTQDRWQPRAGANPQPGDMILFDWDRGNAVKHVAIVEKIENGKVWTIGGNESDSVRNQSYDIGDTRIMGYIPPPGG
ncbi:MAG: CHAP domain-containing protein [Gaiellales bacterium]